MNEYVGILKKGDGLLISDDCLKNGATYGGIAGLTLEAGLHKYIDIRAHVVEPLDIEPRDSSYYELARGSRFRMDNSLTNGYEEKLAESVFMVRTLFFKLDATPKPYIDIRAEILFYGDGNRVWIDQEYQVFCVSERIAQLVRSDGEFWYLDDFDQSQSYLPDDVLGSVTDKKSITEVGNYLDDWFKDIDQEG